MNSIPTIKRELRFTGQGAVSRPHLTIDTVFWGANLVKIPDGGWFPLAVGALVFALMTTWKRGREILGERLSAGTLRFRDFAEQIRTAQIARMPGTAVFIYSNPRGTPRALLHNLEHNKVLHQQVILLSVQTKEIPWVEAEDRIEVQDLVDGFYRVILYYGFRESPNVPRDLALARQHGLMLDLSEVSYFLGSERLLATDQPGMAIWREQLFGLMSRNSRSAMGFFRLPPDRVVELGTQVEL